MHSLNEDNLEKLVAVHCFRNTRSEKLKTTLGEKIWLIHRILQFKSYPLQCTLLPYLHTTAFVSSIVQSSAIAHQPQGRSVAVPFLPSPLQQMENGLPSVHFSLWCTGKSHRMLYPRIWKMFKYSNAFIGKKLLVQKGRCELGYCPDAASRLCSSRDSAASSTRFVALSLLIPTMSTIILTVRCRF